ncbi:MAG TPA: metallophosphoesterase [Gammaproteobacteria bacterium]|nr:metallophosphoesterase [Gammaproteobacteria bacterium]
MRILHFSDPHFDLSLRTLPFKKWFGKRAIGALNLLAGRGRFFDEAEEKIAALNNFKKENGVDLVLCTGDYAALGLDAELRNAAELIAPLTDAPHGFITVPGNHDIYAKDVIKNHYFFDNFGTAMQTDMPEYCTDGIWPFVRLIGDDVAVIAVNSAKPNPLPWRSDGCIPRVQLEALNRILDDVRLTGRFIFVMTHYASRLENGKPDTRLHGLHNADDFLAICKKIFTGALLCGHVHRCYRTPLDGLKADLFCAGSATKEHHEGFWLFDIEDGACHVSQGFFDADAYAYSAREINA